MDDFWGDSSGAVFGDDAAGLLAWSVGLPKVGEKIEGGNQESNLKPPGDQACQSIFLHSAVNVMLSPIFL
jgi:hypothetical protein